MNSNGELASLQRKVMVLWFTWYNWCAAMFIFNLLSCDKCEVIYIPLVLNKYVVEEGLFELLHSCHKPREHKWKVTVCWLLFSNLISPRELLHVPKLVILYLLKWDNSPFLTFPLHLRWLCIHQTWGCLILSDLFA